MIGPLILIGGAGHGIDRRLDGHAGHAVALGHGTDGDDGLGSLDRDDQVHLVLFTQLLRHLGTGSGVGLGVIQNNFDVLLFAVHLNAAQGVVDIGGDLVDDPLAAFAVSGQSAGGGVHITDLDGTAAGAAGGTARGAAALVAGAAASVAAAAGQQAGCHDHAEQEREDRFLLHRSISFHCFSRASRAFPLSVKAELLTEFYQFFP